MVKFNTLKEFKDNLEEFKDIPKKANCLLPDYDPYDRESFDSRWESVNRHEQIGIDFKKYVNDCNSLESCVQNANDDFIYWALLHDIENFDNLERLATLPLPYAERLASIFPEKYFQVVFERSKKGHSLSKKFDEFCPWDLRPLLEKKPEYIRFYPLEVTSRDWVEKCLFNRPDILEKYPQTMGKLGDRWDILEILKKYPALLKRKFIEHLRSEKLAKVLVAYPEYAVDTLLKRLEKKDKSYVVKNLSMLKRN